jgi:hypothetical protein
VTSLALIGLSASNNGTIQAGGFHTGAEIQDTVNRGLAYNNAAIGFGVASLACLGAGVPLIVLSWRPTAPVQISVAPTRGGLGLGLAGRF